MDGFQVKPIHFFFLYKLKNNLIFPWWFQFIFVHLHQKTNKNKDYEHTF